MITRCGVSGKTSGEAQHVFSLFKTEGKSFSHIQSWVLGQSQISDQTYSNEYVNTDEVKEGVIYAYDDVSTFARIKLPDFLSKVTSISQGGKQVSEDAIFTPQPTLDAEVLSVINLNIGSNILKVQPEKTEDGFLLIVSGSDDKKNSGYEDGIFFNRDNTTIAYHLDKEGKLAKVEVLSDVTGSHVSWDSLNGKTFYIGLVNRSEKVDRNRFKGEYGYTENDKIVSGYLTE